MRRRTFVAAPLLLLAPAAGAEQPFPEVVAGRSLQFPRDCGSHPAFRNEWWYVTGWLDSANGNSSGFQVTFFRNRPAVAEDNSSPFAAHELLFAHAAVTDSERGRLRHDERAARAGFGLAAAREADTDVWIGDWSLKRSGAGYRAQIAARDFGFDLQLSPTQPVLLEGDGGVSHKGPLAKQASYYYSEPHLAVKGSVMVGGSKAMVTGEAWLDHEWSSEYMADEAVGWDWTGLNLEDGAALMAFRMRDRSGGTFWAGGTYRSGDGGVLVLQPDDIEFTVERSWRSPRTQVEYPVDITVRIRDRSYSLQPLTDDQELDARTGVGVLYWEGAVHAVIHGRGVGRGYLELTGYGKPLKL